MRTIDELLQRFNEEIKYIPDKSKAEALEVFCNAYQTHKKMHGTYANLQGQEYISKMLERQEYQLNMVKDYIRRKQNE